MEGPRLFSQGGAMDKKPEQLVSSESLEAVRQRALGRLNKKLEEIRKRQADQMGSSSEKPVVQKVVTSTAAVEEYVSPASKFIPVGPGVVDRDDDELKFVPDETGNVIADGKKGNLVFKSLFGA